MNKFKFIDLAKQTLTVLTLIFITTTSSAYALPLNQLLSNGDNTVASTGTQAACDTLNTLDSSQGCGTSASGSVPSLAANVVNIISIVLGAVAIIMILVGGFRFITSNGDANKAASARSTIIYALIGIAIASVAQLLVRFVLTNTNSSLH